MKGFLRQWGLLAIGLLAGGVLLLHEHEGRPARPAYYTVSQVLADWHWQPVAWAGHTVLDPVRFSSPQLGGVLQPETEAGRTVLVRGTVRDSCDLRRPLGHPVGGPAVPCVFPGSGWPFLFLYDPASRALLPLYWWGNDVYGFANGPAVYRVRLRAWRDCGPLGLGQHPCLVGEAPHLVP